MNSIIVCIIIWSVLVEYFAPFKILRYIVPVFPLLSLIFLNIFTKIEDKKQNIFGILFVVIYFLYALFPLKAESDDTFITYKKQKIYIPFGAKLENLYMTESKMDNDTIPVFVESSTWFQPYYIISRLNKHQQYYFAPKFNLDNYPYNHFYLLVTSKENRYEKFYIYNADYKGKFLIYNLYEVYRK